jgi:uncharacterized phiE125 gp8 family phage protein
MATVAPAPVMVAEVKALLRVSTDDEDALIAGFVRSAAASCEAFTGQALIAREVREVVVANGVWQRLAAAPVRTIDAVAGVASDGSETLLATNDYAIDVDAAGEGWVRVPWRGARVRAAVQFSAGLAEDWNGVPEPLRQGIARLAAHLYTARGESEAAPPASVAALWRPWRRMRIG